MGRFGPAKLCYVCNEDGVCISACEDYKHLLGKNLKISPLPYDFQDFIKERFLKAE